MTTPSNAPPSWRTLPFFQLGTQSLNPSSPLSQPSQISTIVSSPALDLVLCADIEGNISVLDDSGEIGRSWVAFPGGRCTHIAIAEGRWTGVVFTIGEEQGSPHSILKIYDLSNTPTTSESTPILLRDGFISLTNPHPITALAVSSNLDYLVVGFANGLVVAWKKINTQLELAAAAIARGEPSGALDKNRVVWEGKEPITGLGFRLSGASSALLILTVSHVLACPLGSLSKKSKQVVVLDDLGAAIGCCAVMDNGSDEAGRMAVARDEAVYIYGAEGREGCWAIEGPKTFILPLTSTQSHNTRSSYLAIIAPPIASASTSTSATLRNFAKSSSSSSSRVSKVTIFDPTNKFIAYSGGFEEMVWGVWEAFGCVWIGVEGKVYRLTEQDLKTSLGMLFTRNLYTLAISLAKSRGCKEYEIADIYKRYGDHLYSKGDYEGSMNCYLKTTGTIQPSYVIRKFLDAQRLSFLTIYLQELHSKSLANSDHTTLLLNCYTKLADDSALAEFIHSSSSSKLSIEVEDPPFNNNKTEATDEPPFDLETAIRVCRQAGYFDHAAWLAERYNSHADYLRIQIEDRGDFQGSLNYLRKLNPRVIEESIMLYGTALLDALPEDTTQFLIELCCGELHASVQNGAEDTNENGHSKQDKYIPDARNFFSFFVFLTRYFIQFLEEIAKRSYGKSISTFVGSSDSTRSLKQAKPESNEEDLTVERAIWNTLLELYLSGSGVSEEESRSKALVIIESKAYLPYDESRALLICTTWNFTEGLVVLYENLGMYDEIIRYYIDTYTPESPNASDQSAKVIESVKKYGSQRPYLYQLVLRFLTTSSELLTRHQDDIVQILDVIDAENIIPPVKVIQLLSMNTNARVMLVKDYLKKKLVLEKEEIEADQALIDSYQKETKEKKLEIEQLSDPKNPRIFQVTRCTTCGGQLDLPAMHFMCRHSYHLRCLGENEKECPQCAQSHSLVWQIKQNNESLVGRHDLFLEQVEESSDRFGAVVGGFGKGLMKV